MTRKGVSKPKKRCEIYLQVPDNVSAKNKNLLNYVKNLFYTQGVVALVVFDTDQVQAPRGKNACCVITDLTEHQYEILQNHDDILGIKEALVKK